MRHAFDLCPHGCGSAVLISIWKQECGDGIEKRGPGWADPEGDGLHSPLTGDPHQCSHGQVIVTPCEAEAGENTVFF